VRIGIVGLPNVGKSSLFNLLTSAGAPAESYPFTTIDVNRGMAFLPDPLLRRLGELLRPPKLTPAHIEVVDIAGLIKDAHKGEGLGNRFLGHIRDADLLLHVVRGFTEESVPHVFESVDPARDAEVVLAELGLADLELVERRLAKERKRVEAREEVELLERYRALISEGCFSLNGSWDAEERRHLKSLGLLLPRPALRVLNLPDERSEVSLEGAYRLSVSLEEGLEEFSAQERAELRTEVGVDPRGPAGVLDSALELLGLIRFYTIKGDEVRAWTLPVGSSALDAAAKIHTDIAKGFIKAEVVPARALIEAGSWAKAAVEGRLKVEGKDYPVQDEDVLLIKFR